MTDEPESFNREALPHEPAAYLEQAQGMNMQEFEARHPYPFFLYARSKLWDPSLLASSRPKSSGGFGGEETMLVSYDFIQGGFVFLSALRKLQSDISKPGIFLGRVTENDVVVPVPSISSIHLRLTPPLPGGQLVWKVRDLGSRNGTWLNEERLTAQMDVPINDGEYLRLGGNLISWFLYPGRLWHLLTHSDEMKKLTDL